MSTLKDPALTASFIAPHEGFRSTPYWDVNGWAIGYGNHYNADGSPVQPGQTIDQAGAQSLLQNQIQNTYAPAIANRIGEPAWSNMTPEQQAAYVDAAYNYGPSSKCLSDAVGAAQSGDSQAMSDQLGGLSSNPGRRADEAALINGTYSGNVSKGGPSANLPPNAKGAAPGTGAGCAGGGFGILGAIAGGGLLGGLGLGSILGPITGALGLSGITGALGSALGSIGNVLGGGLAQALGQVAGPLNSITGGALNALSGMGAGILPSLTGVLPSSITGVLGGALNGAVGGLLQPLSGVLQNPLGISNAMQHFAVSGGLGGVLDKVASNMVGNATNGGVQSFMQNIGIANAYSGIANNMVGAVAEASGLRFGANGPGALGANFVNQNSVVSYGMTSLSSNLPGAASDLSNLGNFATTNLFRMQQPSHVAHQILAAGLGATTGLTSQLTSAKIPLAGLDNPVNDTKVQNILNSISDPNAIGSVSSTFNIGVPIDHLGQLTDMNHMCPTLSATTPSRNFAELGQHFLHLGMTNAKNFNQIGTALTKVDAGFDLNHISQMSTPFYQPAADKLNQTFGFGGGSLGEITMADFIGTAAGYVHKDTIPVIVDFNNRVMATPDGQTLAGMITTLQSLLTGGLTIPGHNGDPSKGIPAMNSFISMNGQPFQTLDDAVIFMVQSIEAQLTVIKNNPDPDFQNALQAAEQAHAASCAQVLKENHHIKTFKMDLFAPVENNPINAYVFADGLPYFGQQTGYGQIGEYLEKVASDNIYGDAIKAAMRMGRNAAALESLGVNTDRFKLPHSQYYRDPAAFYVAAYSGELPAIPENLKDPYIPSTPQEIYIDSRNKILDENGYNPDVMLPAQADETYYDLQWKDVDPTIKERLGLDTLRQAIDRNIKVYNNNINVIGLDGTISPVATINSKGLILQNPDNLLKNLFNIVNSILYGNLGVTKLETPFATDQMIYGTLEMLSQVTPQNVDALKNTLLGNVALSGLLDKLKTTFDTILKIDTTMDRNLIAPWGGSGPDGQTQILTRK